MGGNTTAELKERVEIATDNIQSIPGDHGSSFKSNLLKRNGNGNMH